MKIFTSIIFITVFLSVFSTRIYAQQIGLSLTPSLHEITAKPNTTIDLKFTLENIGDPALVSLKLVNSAPSDTFGNVALKQSLSSPILFNIKEYNLENGKPFIMKTKEQKKISLTLEIPEDIKEKDYYYSLIAQTSPPPAEDGSISARGSLGIASNILISVAKEFPADSKAKIVLFEIPGTYKLGLFGKTIYVVNSSKPITTVLTVQNNEIHRIKPSGIINISSTFGEKKSYALPPQNILAESQRTIQAELAYRNNEATLYLPSLKPGLYTMQTTLSLPVSSTKLESTLEFIALPFTLLNWLGLLIAVTIIIFLIYRKKNHSEFETD
jgi:hypothetical protein